MLEVKDVTKRFGAFTAIEDINFTFGEGSIFGLVGYNGAGKTTLLKTLCGVLIPETGSVTLHGEPVFDNAAAKSRIFFVSDDLYILPQATMDRMAHFYRGYYPGWNDTLYKKLAAIFKLDGGKRMSSFSKGMQRQAFIIFAMSASCEYLLLDEAFDGIDPMMRELVRRLLLESIAEKGTSILISSHNLRELEDLCDRIAVINGKRFVLDENVDDLRSRMYPLTLEEIFLQEMEAETHDFTDLFK
jgi:ABC-2 type transport system ATP-binding protein